MYAEQEAAIERVLAHERDPAAPKNTKSLIANKLAFGAGVFALAHWVPPEQVFKQLMRLETLALTTIETMDREKLSPQDIPVFLVLFSLDNTFKVNAILYSAQHESVQNQKRVDEMLKTVAALQKKSVVLMPWDAEVTSYDVLHRAFGKPLDKTKAIEVLTIHEFDTTMLMDRRSQLPVVQRLGELCGAIKESKTDP